MGHYQTTYDQANKTDPRNFWLKQRSRKARHPIRFTANRVAWKMPATIEDPAVLDNSQAALRAFGYAEKS